MKFKDLFDEKGYILITSHNKPSLKEVVEYLANVTFYITKHNDIPKLLECPQIILPEHIRLSRIIYALTDEKKGPFTDNLFFSRVLCCYHG